MKNFILSKIISVKKAAIPKANAPPIVKADPPSNAGIKVFAKNPALPMNPAIMNPKTNTNEPNTNALVNLFPLLFAIVFSSYIFLL